MKTDTENSIRVTITLNRESNPEWFFLLSSVVSGRARAEIVRKHLATPRVEGRFQLPAAQATARPSSPSGTEVAAPSEPVYLEGAKVNSSEISTGATSQNEAKSAAVKRPSSETVNVGVPQNKADVNNEGAADKAGVNNDGVKNKAGVNNEEAADKAGVNEPASAKQSRGGLASVLLNHGRTGISDV